MSIRFISLAQYLTAIEAQCAEILDYTEIQRRFGRKFNIDTDVDSLISALLSIKQLQACYDIIDHQLPIQVWEVCLGNSPKSRIAKPLTDNKVITDNLEILELSDKFEKITLDTSVYKTFLSYEEALQWRYRSSLAYYKNGYKYSADIKATAERDIFQYEADKSRQSEKTKLPSTIDTNFITTANTWTYTSGPIEGIRFNDDAATEIIYNED